MKVSALLTSAGINIGICALLLCLYSILRKQPGNAHVYFGRRLARDNYQRRDPFIYERLVPSISWILKAWVSTENDIMADAGLDSVVFLRLLVFSIRIFSIAAVICMFLVLPLNYFGQEMEHKHIPKESLEVFTIENVKQGSEWLWAHCLALYIISISACILLYFEYKRIAKLRLVHITRSPSNLSHFAILVRAIPWSLEEPFTVSVKNFFMKYHASSYLSHQMVYRTGKIEKIMKDAKKIYKKLVYLTPACMDQKYRASRVRCGLCGGTSTSFHLYSNELQLAEKKPGLDHLDSLKEKECPAAFVFFKTRYAAVIASQILQTSNPMLWVTDLAPEPDDVKWSNLWIPYKQLWLRRIATLLASIVFMFLFLIPVTFVQGLSQLEQLQQMFPFLRSILRKAFVSQVVTGYLPSVVLLLFLYTVPPMMMVFSTVEGSISRSSRKKSTCVKVLYFTIWNVFFVNVLSGSAISQLNLISSPKGIPTQLAKAVPRQANFFITYVLTSGWVSLSSEVVQVFALVWSLSIRYILRQEEDTTWVPSFPYHTEVPRILLFGLIGFTCSILAPLIVPFLLIYFLLAYVVYRNQIINVYYPKYETGGQYWPIMHNTTIFSLVLAQIIALGVFGIKESPVASGFTIPLVILTLLFNEYCRQRFHPIFQSYSAQDLIEMDRQDEASGRMEEIHGQVLLAYRQPIGAATEDTNIAVSESSCSSQESVGGVTPPTRTLSLSRLQAAFTWLSMLITLQDRNQPPH